MVRTAVLLLLAAFVLGSPPVSAQTKKKKGETSLVKGPPCSSSAFHQFDFWIGDWDVTTPQGMKAGLDRVEKVLEGCALLENWSASDGSKATSLSAFDAGSRSWHQTFADDQGTLLILDGEMREGRLVLLGTKQSGKQRTLNRLSWQSTAADKLRQRWEISQDEGKNWSLLFEGLYTRRKPKS